MRPQLGILALLTLLASFSAPFSIEQIVSFSTNQVLAQTPEGRKAEADRLRLQGLQQQTSRQFEAAIQSLERALTIYKEIGDRQQEGQVLGSLGSIYLSLGNYGKALEYDRQRLDLMRKIADRQGEAHALISISQTYSILGKKNKILDYQLQSLAITRSIRDRRQEGLRFTF